jgi:hypothetical protein
MVFGGLQVQEQIGVSSPSGISSLTITIRPAVG